MKKFFFAFALSVGIIGSAAAQSATQSPVVNQIKSEYQSLTYVSQLSQSEKDGYLATRFSDWKTIPVWGKDAVVFLLRNHCIEPDGDRVAGQQFNVQQPLTTLRAGNDDLTKRVELFKLLAQFAARIGGGECAPGAFSSLTELKAAQDVLKVADAGLAKELKELKDHLAILQKRPDGDQVARDALAALRDDYLSLANLRFDIADKFSGINVKIGNLADELLRQNQEIEALKARKPLNGQQGAAGSNGTSGAKGDKGESGVSGSAGTNGINGTSGAKGDTGSAGVAGSQGNAGLSGQKGDAGSAGQTGAQGAPGRDGKDGQTIYVPAPAAPAAPVTVTNTNTLTVNVYGGVATTAPDGKTVDVRMPAVITPSVIPAKPVFVCNGDSRVLSTVQVCISPVEICFYLLDGTPITVLRYEAASGGYVYYLANGTQVLVTRVQGGISVQQVR